jgi:hypothetical protein
MVLHEPQRYQGRAEKSCAGLETQNALPLRGSGRRQAKEAIGNAIHKVMVIGNLG